MTEEELREKIDDILWDLFSLAKNPHDMTNKYRSVADASKDIMKLIKADREAAIMEERNWWVANAPDKYSAERIAQLQSNQTRDDNQ